MMRINKMAFVYIYIIYNIMCGLCENIVLERGVGEVEWKEKQKWSKTTSGKTMIV